MFCCFVQYLSDLMVLPEQHCCQSRDGPKLNSNTLEPHLAEKQARTQLLDQVKEEKGRRELTNARGKESENEMDYTANRKEQTKRII